MRRGEQTRCRSVSNLITYPISSKTLDYQKSEGRFFMFHTVLLKTKPIYIDSDFLNQHKPKMVTFYNKETAALNTRYEIYDEKLPYIKYLESSQTLQKLLVITNYIYLKLRRKWVGLIVST
jgi:hypothetical protein